MYYRYTRVHYANGRPTHRIEGYHFYTAEDGLIGKPVIEVESGRIATCMKGLPMTPKQDIQLRALARERIDGIAMPDGTYKAN
jgi:hypothetical protein